MQDGKRDRTATVRTEPKRTGPIKSNVSVIAREEAAILTLSDSEETQDTTGRTGQVEDRRGKERREPKQREERGRDPGQGKETGQVRTDNRTRCPGLSVHSEEDEDTEVVSTQGSLTEFRGKEKRWIEGLDCGEPILIIGDEDKYKRELEEMSKSKD
ncbi:hypothetical protein GN956_G11565 [Arapaima gigas]